MADVTINKKLRNSDAGMVATTTFNSVTKDPSAFQFEIGRSPSAPTVGTLSLDSLVATAGAGAKAFTISQSGSATATFSTTVKTQGGTTSTITNGTSNPFSLAATTAGTVVVTVVATSAGAPDSPVSQDFSIVVS